MKHLQTNQEFRFNEVLFEHRNKEYGAYVLRNESDKILTKALFVGVSLLAAISITPLAISAFKSEAPLKAPIAPVYHPMDIPNDPPVKDPPAQIKPEPLRAEKVKTYDDRLPEPKAIVRNEKKEIVDKENALASTQTSPGKEVENTKYIPALPQNIGTGSIPQVKPEIPAEKPDPKKIETELSVEANFVGGIDSFRNKVMNNFDGSGFETDGVVKTTITFIVEIDGTISGIKANGTNADFNSEAMRTIKSIRGKWVPGKNKNGEAVRSYFKFPISMKFDQ
ncbi:energy transducer TonB [Chryseobacterium paridis]|uniref:Energy transducer TonB n=1 Tax=Chryseobacterium paridis TaxID=2800328 RepID=A0ABS1FSX7_9FLAO|nr:energy transducer TonB [Chryseobacterium paridis]MBK1895527.1 energy transducer TonB [Chryseobacterium paridis]